MSAYFHLKLSDTPKRIGSGFGAHSGEVVIVDEVKTVESSRTGVQFRCWFKGLKEPRWLDAGWLSEAK